MCVCNNYSTVIENTQLIAFTGLSDTLNNKVYSIIKVYLVTEYGC